MTPSARERPPLQSLRIRGVPFLLLDRPERRNPLDAATRRALELELRRAGEAGRPAVAIGATPHEPPVFAAGADLRAIAALTPSEAPAFAEEGQRLHRLAEDLSVQLVAVIDGPCFGGALDLAMACDTVLASKRARFAHPGIRLGIVTGWGGTRRLPQRIGAGRAAALLQTGRALGAQEAASCGLVSAVLPVEGFLEACAEAITTGSAPPGAALRLAKRATRPESAP